MPVTKEQWSEIEKSLTGIFGEVSLRCDGYEIKAVITTVSPMRMGIAVYVNGWIKGEWVKGDAEEARKFHREKKSYLYAAAHRKEALVKARGRHVTAEMKQWYRDVATKSISVWAPYWTNAKAFTRHLRKTCKDIEVVSIGISV